MGYEDFFRQDRRPGTPEEDPFELQTEAEERPEDFRKEVETLVECAQRLKDIGKQKTAMGAAGIHIVLKETLEMLDAKTKSNAKSRSRYYVDELFRLLKMLQNNLKNPKAVAQMGEAFLASLNKIER